MSISPDDVSTSQVLVAYVIWFAVALAVVVIALLRNANRRDGG